MFKFFASLFLGITTLFSGMSHQAAQVVSNSTNNSTTPTSANQVIVSQDQLLAMAGNPYADGNLPLGSNKYVTTGPKKGYIYLCHAQQDPSGGGAQVTGSWIHGSTWNMKEKLSVQGKVSWPNAKFTNTLANSTRTLTGNDLPSHTTGIFPIQSTDPASKYDRNPNSITSQSFSDSFPVSPTYSDTPSCMGGEAGIMLTGVALFNGFDAQLRDAAAYEVQDSCQGHPEKTGEYHYHSLSSCITGVSETTVIGYALDGFPITGPKVAENKYLTTNNLDECHGITSEILLDGKKVTTYHYVMTQDFPYSVSCFRGKPVSLQVIGNQQGGQRMQNQQNSTNTQRPQPPQQAFSVCLGKASGTSCSFSAPRGTVQGTCQTPPGQQSLLCVPTNPEQNQGQPLQ